MKEKIIKIITIVFIITTTITIMLFLKKNYQIILNKNIKQISNQKSTESNNKNTTIIDITNLNSNIIIEHEHMYKTEYNTDNHWKECSICHTKIDINSHQYKDNGWTMGINNCSEVNVHNYSCECGYSYDTTVGRKSHNLKSIQNTASFAKYYQCSVCNTTKDYHNCRKSNGTKINCNNLGSCSICGYNYTGYIHIRNINNNAGVSKGNLTCELCGTNNIAYVNYSKLEKISDLEYKYNVSMTVPNGATPGNITLLSGFGNNINMTNTTSTTGTTWTNSVSIKFKEHTENITNVNMYWSFYANGSWKQIGFLSEIFKADTTSPQISNILIDSENQWKKTKGITITGTENYCNTVKIKLIDIEKSIDSENIIFEGTANVNNQKYSINCVPYMETDLDGKKIKAIVTDNCQNKTEQEFIIKKVDNDPPEVKSETELEKNWKKSKKIIFKATDNGVGNVSIAFNDAKDLQLATLNEKNEYTREYELTGDVYNSKELSVLYKDELGNATIQKITIDKLDNTSPTITNVSIHNNKLSITANDIKEGIGEGSGVSKYKYITSGEKLTNPEIPDTVVEVNSNENIIIENISEVKYIYAVAEDLVGNISEIYEFKIPRARINKQNKLKCSRWKRWNRTGLVRL